MRQKLSKKRNTKKNNSNKRVKKNLNKSKKGGAAIYRYFMGEPIEEQIKKSIAIVDKLSNFYQMLNVMMNTHFDFYNDVYEVNYKTDVYVGFKDLNYFAIFGIIDNRAIDNFVLSRNIEYSLNYGFIGNYTNAYFDSNNLKPPGFYKNMSKILKKHLNQLNQYISEYTYVENAIKNAGLDYIIDYQRIQVPDEIRTARNRYYRYILNNQNAHSYIKNFRYSEEHQDIYREYMRVSELFDNEDLKFEKENSQLLKLNQIPDLTFRRLNFEFINKCKKLGNTAALQYRYFDPVNQYDIGLLQVIRGGGNLLVEFFQLKSILKLDAFVLQHLYNFAENLVMMSEKKYYITNQIQPRVLEDLQKGPYYTYQRAKNLTQNLSDEELYNFLGEMPDELITNPNTLRERGLYKRGRQPSNSNQFFDALTGSEQN